MVHAPVRRGVRRLSCLTVHTRAGVSERQRVAFRSSPVPFGWPANNGLRRMRQREHTFVNSKSGRYALYCAGNEKAISGG